MLKDSAMERFLTTPLEEREKFEQMKSLSARLSSNEAVIAKLEKELNDAIAERDSEVSEGVGFSSHLLSIIDHRNTHIYIEKCSNGTVRLITVCLFLIVDF